MEEVEAIAKASLVRRASLAKWSWWMVLAEWIKPLKPLHELTDLGNDYNLISYPKIEPEINDILSVMIPFNSSIFDGAISRRNSRIFDNQ